MEEMYQCLDCHWVGPAEDVIEIGGNENACPICGSIDLLNLTEQEDEYRAEHQDEEDWENDDMTDEEGYKFPV